MPHSWEEPKEKKKKKNFKNAAQLDYFEFNDLIRGKNPLLDSRLKKYFCLPDYSDYQKKVMMRREAKDKMIKTGYTEPDPILSTKISLEDRIKFDPVNYFQHLGHHIRIEREDKYFSIICTTCGHDSNNNHVGEELERIYPNEERFNSLFERKKQRKKRYYYYTCGFCECQISMMYTSDKWLLNKCPLCDSHNVTKRRNTDLYDHEAVSMYSEFLQIKHINIYMEMRFKHLYMNKFPLFIKDKNDNPILSYRYKTHNPYITKEDYIAEMHRRRPRLVLADNHFLTNQTLIDNLPKKSNSKKIENPLSKTQLRRNFDAFE